MRCSSQIMFTDSTPILSSRLKSRSLTSLSPSTTNSRQSPPKLSSSFLRECIYHLSLHYNIGSSRHDTTSSIFSYERPLASRNDEIDYSSLDAYQYNQLLKRKLLNLNYLTNSEPESSMLLKGQEDSLAIKEPTKASINKSSSDVSSSMTSLRNKSVTTINNKKTLAMSTSKKEAKKSLINDILSLVSFNSNTKAVISSDQDYSKRIENLHQEVAVLNRKRIDLSKNDQKINLKHKLERLKDELDSDITTKPKPHKSVAILSTADIQKAAAAVAKNSKNIKSSVSSTSTSSDSSSSESPNSSISSSPSKSILKRSESVQASPPVHIVIELQPDKVKQSTSFSEMTTYLSNGTKNGTSNNSYYHYTNSNNSHNGTVSHHQNHLNHSTQPHHTYSSNDSSDKKRIKFIYGQPEHHSSHNGHNNNNTSHYSTSNLSSSTNQPSYSANYLSQHSSYNPSSSGPPTTFARQPLYASTNTTRHRTGSYLEKHSSIKGARGKNRSLNYRVKFNDVIQVFDPDRQRNYSLIFNKENSTRSSSTTRPVHANRPPPVPVPSHSVTTPSSTSSSSNPVPIPSHKNTVLSSSNNQSNTSSNNNNKKYPVVEFLFSEKAFLPPPPPTLVKSTVQSKMSTSSINGSNANSSLPPKSPKTSVPLPSTTQAPVSSYENPISKQLKSNSYVNFSATPSSNSTSNRNSVYTTSTSNTSKPIATYAQPKTDATFQFSNQKPASTTITKSNLTSPSTTSFGYGLDPNRRSSSFNTPSSSSSSSSPPTQPKAASVTNGTVIPISQQLNNSYMSKSMDSNTNKYTSTSSTSNTSTTKSLPTSSFTPGSLSKSSTEPTAESASSQRSVISSVTSPYAYNPASLPPPTYNYSTTLTYSNTLPLSVINAASKSSQDQTSYTSPSSSYSPTKSKENGVASASSVNNYKQQPLTTLSTSNPITSSNGTSNNTQSVYNSLYSPSKAEFNPRYQPTTSNNNSNSSSSNSNNGYYNNYIYNQPSNYTSSYSNGTSSANGFNNNSNNNISTKRVVEIKNNSIVAPSATNPIKSTSFGSTPLVSASSVPIAQSQSNSDTNINGTSDQGSNKPSYSTYNGLSFSLNNNNYNNNNNVSEVETSAASISLTSNNRASTHDSQDSPTQWQKPQVAVESSEFPSATKVVEQQSSSPLSSSPESVTMRNMNSSSGATMYELSNGNLISNSVVNLENSRRYSSGAVPASSTSNDDDQYFKNYLEQGGSVRRRSTQFGNQNNVEELNEIFQRIYNRNRNGNTVSAVSSAPLSTLPEVPSSTDAANEIEKVTF